MAISVTNIAANFSTTGATVAIAVPAGGVPATALICVAICDRSSAAPAGSVVDTKGNSYAAVIGASRGGVTSNGFGRVFRAYNAVALVSGNAITYTKAVSGSRAAITAFYATGILNTADPADASVSASSVGSSTTPSVISGAPGATGELFVGAIALPGNVSAPQPPGDWNAFLGSQTGTSTTDALISGGWKINLGTTALPFAPTLASSGNWADLVCSFRPAAAPVANLTAGAIAVSAPVVGTPPSFQFVALAASMPARNPEIGTPPLKQKHAFTAAPLTVRSPVFKQYAPPGFIWFDPVPAFSVAALQLGSPLVHVAHGPWTPTPTFSEQIDAANDLLSRVLDGLLKTIPGRMIGRPAWDVRRAVGDIRANSKALIVNGTLGDPAIEAWGFAAVAGATFDTFDVLRKGIIAEEPLSLPAQEVAHLALRLTLSQMAIFTATTEFVARDQALAALNRLSAAFAPAEEDAADERDPVMFRALIASRAAAVRDLAERGRQLPRIVPYSFATAMPSLWIANRIYGDGSRSDELLAENHMVHPAFAPPDGVCLSR